MRRGRGGLKIGRGARRRRRAEERLWSDFLDTPPFDEANLLVGQIRSAPPGPSNPVKAELHSPAAMHAQFKELALLLGAVDLAVVALDEGSVSKLGDLGGAVPAELLARPYAVVILVPADVDPDVSRGLGGQIPVLKGLMVAHVLSSYIREYGYDATTCASSLDTALAELAGLGQRDADGRLRRGGGESAVWVADIIYTDMPLGPAA